jgi:glycosyltransferase involved in cell wall biosynthesis
VGFRDEWATNPHLNSQPRALTRLATRAEFAITSTARRIVVAADYFRLAGLPAGDPRRRVIFNGVDERDLPTPRLVQSGEKFVLAHVGTLYESVDPSPVFRALAALAARNEIDGGRVQLRLVGSNWLPNFEPPRGLHVEQTGYVDHARALEEMGAATALLLYVPKSSLAPSGKLFEYLASGRPVLSCAHTDSLASRLVTEWDAGVTADPHDEAQIEQAILTLWQRWEEDGLPDQAEVRSRTLEHYSRQANSEQLAEVFEESLQ